MAYIEKRRTSDGKLRYRVLIRLKGHSSVSATFHRLTDAKRWVQKAETEIRENRFFKAQIAKQHSLRELIAKYTNRESRSGGNLGGNPSFLDLSNREQHRRNVQLDWWASRMGDLSLADVTPLAVKEWRDRLAEGDGPTSQPVSSATVNRYLAALSAAFTFARKELGWIDSNPVRDVTRLREPRGRVRFLSDEERDLLLKACQGSSDRRLYPLVVFALSTGARQGELLGLRWRDLDFRRSSAVLHNTKNNERRAIPIVGLAKEELQKLGTVRRVDTDLVFASSRGKVSFPRKAWVRALEEAEIEDFHFHDLRHSAASYLAMSGATLAEIAEVLGHKTLQMVKRYSHLTEQHTSKVVARMNEKFLGGENSR